VPLGGAVFGRVAVERAAQVIRSGTLTVIFDGRLEEQQRVEHGEIRAAARGVVPAGGPIPISRRAPAGVPRWIGVGQRRAPQA
jgi:hypothetical protein